MPETKLLGTLERDGGISLDEVSDLIGGGGVMAGMTELPGEMTLWVLANHGRARVSLTAGSVATEHVDARHFGQLGYVITAEAAGDADEALAWLETVCAGAAITICRGKWS